VYQLFGDTFLLPVYAGNDKIITRKGPILKEEIKDRENY
jgi:hypothetical protein